MNGTAKDSTFIPLTDTEKNEIVEKHKKIVFYMAQKYRNLDTELEEVQSWCFLGLAEAIYKYERNPEHSLSYYAFSAIKTRIFREYKKYKLFNTDISLQDTIVHSDSELGQFIAHEDVYISEHDIYSLIEEALFEETELNRSITIDYITSDATVDELCKKYKISSAKVKHAYNRGLTLIKQHLINNDIISDFPNEPKTNKKDKKTKGIKEIKPSEYGKLRYLRMTFPQLTNNDIAEILNTSSYVIDQLVNYPTASYMTATIDRSIHQKAVEYMKDKYPEKLPSDVITYELNTNDKIASND